MSIDPNSFIPMSWRKRSVDGSAVCTTALFDVMSSLKREKMSTDGIWTRDWTVRTRRQGLSKDISWSSGIFSCQTQTLLFVRWSSGSQSQKGIDTLRKHHFQGTVYTLRLIIFIRKEADWSLVISRWMAADKGTIKLTEQWNSTRDKGKITSMHAGRANDISIELFISR